MSWRYRKKNYSERNKFEKEWTERNNYYPKKNNNYNNSYNSYNNNYNYNYKNNNYYHNSNKNKYNNNYYNNNYYNNNYYNYYNYNYKRGKRPYNNYYYKEVEVERTNERDEKFKEDLKNIGYYIKEVEGDGNCLFRSVAEQIEENENNFQEYRGKCVEYMKENKDSFAPFLDEGQPIDEYIEKISKSGEWGGNLEIYALSMALHVNFYIYIFEQPVYVVKNWDDPKKDIMLTYHNGKHYNSLRKLEENFFEDKDKENVKEEDNKEVNTEDIKENQEDNEKEENKEVNKDKDKESQENNEKEKDVEKQSENNEKIKKYQHLNI